MIDLLFPAFGETIPTDHAYPLYATLAAVVPAFHEPDARLCFAPLGGTPDAPGRLRLTDFSRLRVRLPADRIPLALPLAGKRLDIAGHSVRLGVPTVTTLTPAPSLFARLVTINDTQQKRGDSKIISTPERFLDSVRIALTKASVQAEPSLPVILTGPRAGEPRRRVVRIKGRAIVGYSLLLSGLSAEDSIIVQESGLGGRTRMGCGFFLPARMEGV